MVSCDRVSVPADRAARARSGGLAGEGPGCAADLPQRDARTPHRRLRRASILPRVPEVMTPTEYADLFVDRVAECIVRAWENQAPGAVGWGSATL